MSTPGHSRSRPRGGGRAAGVAALVPLVVAAAALTLAGTRDAATPPDVPEPTSRLVGADRRTCPAFPLPDDVTGAVTDVGATAPGRRTVRAGVAGEPVDEPVVETDGDAAWGTATLSAAEVADLVVTGSDAAAAFTAARLPDGAGGGLAVQRCAAPARQWWFVGAGSSTERESTLLLSNPDATDAVVDVTLRGDEGPLETVGTDGVRVRAGETVPLPLAELVAGEEEVAVEVDAAQGRVVAAVADAWSGSVDPRGTAWLPAAAAPAEQVLLPGVADGGPRSRLVVANPGVSGTTVDLSVVDADGSFVPSRGETELTVPAGGVAVVDAPSAPDTAGDETYGVLVEARTPVTAALRLATSADVGYVVAGPTLTGPAVLPVDLGESLADSTAVLSVALPVPLDLAAADVPPARSVRVLARGSAGEVLAESTVEVPAGTLQQLAVDDLDLSAGDRADVAYLEVRPSRGGDGGEAGLLGAATWLGPSDLAAVLPLDSGLVRVPLPVVTPAQR